MNRTTICPCCTNKMIIIEHIIFYKKQKDKSTIESHFECQNSECSIKIIIPLPERQALRLFIDTILQP